MKQTTRQMSDRMIIGLLLAFVGGYLDVYTYLTRGHVFANAQTGNIVLMGIHMAHAEFRVAASYLLPIISFVIGIGTVEFIRTRYRREGHVHWRQIIVLIETVIITAVAFVPGGDADIIVNSLISFVTSMQMYSFRKMEGNPYVTTVCTGNLRSAGAHFFQYMRSREKKSLIRSLKYMAVIGAFIAGAVISVFMTERWGEHSVFPASAVLAIAFLLMIVVEGAVPGDGSSKTDKDRS